MTKRRIKERNNIRRFHERVFYKEAREAFIIVLGSYVFAVVSRQYIFLSL